MEFYSYVNIFETKGLEYLLLLSFLVLFILLVRYLSGPEKKNSAAGNEETRRPTGSSMPTGLKCCSRWNRRAYAIDTDDASPRRSYRTRIAGNRR